MKKILYTSILFMSLAFGQQAISQIQFEKLDRPVGVTTRDLQVVGESVYLESYKNLYYKASPTADWQMLPFFLNSNNLAAQRYFGENEVYYQLFDKKLYAFNPLTIEWDLLQTFPEYFQYFNILEDGSLIAIDQQRYLLYAPSPDQAFVEIADMNEVQDGYNASESVEYHFENIIVSGNKYALVAGDRKDQLYFVEVYEKDVRVDFIPPTVNTYRDGYFDELDDLVWNGFGIERYNFADDEFENIEKDGGALNSGLYQMHHYDDKMLIYFAQFYYLSLDRGESWTRLEPYSSLGVIFQQAILAVSEQGFVLSGPGDGSYELHQYNWDGELINTYLTEFNEWHCRSTRIQSGKMLANSNDGHSYESLDDGQSWRKLNLGEMIQMNVHFHNGKYYTADYTGFYESADREAWTEISTSGAQDFIKSKGDRFALASNGDVKIYDTETQVLKSFDIDASAKVGDFHPNGNYYYMEGSLLKELNYDSGQVNVINDLASIDPMSGYYLKISFDGTFIIIDDGFSGLDSYHSEDLGVSFTKGSSVAPMFGGYRYHINEDGFFMVAEDHVIYSGDNMKSHTEIPIVGQEDLNVIGAFVDENHFMYLAVGPDGLIKSTTALDLDNRITGSIYSDTNGDCVNNGELSLTNQALTFTNSSNETYNVYVGASPFVVSLPRDDYTVRHAVDDNIWDPCNDEYFVDQSVPTVLDIGIKPIADCSDVSAQFTKIEMRRCFDNQLHFSICNTGTVATPDGSICDIELDPAMIFKESSYGLINLQDSIYTFDVSGIAPFDCQRITIRYELSCDDTELGDIHCLSGSVSLPESCTGIDQVYYVENCMENIGSFDPNDMHAVVENVWTQEKDIKLETSEVDYLVRFQNTGTDTAFTVRVLSQISEYIDYERIEVLDYSHPFVFTTNSEGMMDIVFDDILLPDSTTNLMASQGFIKFKARINGVLEDGDQIKSQADIFFDFNEPVTTNEVVLTATKPSSVLEENHLAFKLYPNPVNDILSIQLEDQSGSAWIKIYDVFGKQVFNGQMNQSVKEIDCSPYTPGIYMVVATQGNLETTKVMIKTD